MKYSTLVCLCALLAACYKSTNPQADAGPGSDSSMSDVPFRDTEAPDVVIDSGPPVRVEQVDMLFMIDNSRSMVEEQASLAAELPNMVQILASGEIGGRPFPTVVDLRVGFVTSDMGTGGYTIPTCNEPNFGDDGILHRGAGCGVAAGSPPYIGLRPGDGDDVDGFADAAACLVRVGTEGCGFEQQLDATLKALTPTDGTFPSGDPVTFVRGSRGHGDGINESFVRDGSLLVVVILTDEDDCSAANPELYDRDSPIFDDPDLNLRCSRYGDPDLGAVYPVSRYVDGLLALHPANRLVYAVIAGVPVDIAPARGEAIPFELLVGDESVRDPRMLERPDPAMPSQLTPACSVPGRGDAFPAVRLVRVAQGLQRRGAEVSVQSICQDDYYPLLDHIINHL